jgi:hypothetical protein
VKTSIPSSITVEEAVARLINLDYIPTGFTLDEMTSAFLEEAEVEYHNACLDRSAAGQLDALKDRVDVCRARHYLGQKLHDALIQELKKTIDSPIELANGFRRHDAPEVGQRTGLGVRTDLVCTLRSGQHYGPTTTAPTDHRASTRIGNR